MESNEKKSIRVFVKSKRIPVVTTCNIPQLLPIGSSVILTSSRRRIVRYENVLDDYQEGVLDSVRKFASNHDMRLEVTDITRESILKQLLRRIVGQKIDSIDVKAPESMLNVLWRNSAYE